MNRQDAKNAKEKPKRRNQKLDNSFLSSSLGVLGVLAV
jgi:hypothetical protein